MWYDGGWAWGGWLVMAVTMLLFWALVITGIVALVRYLAGSRHDHHQPGPAHSRGENGWGGRRAEDLLAERFARGEVDEDEYRRKLTLLREQR